MQVRKNNNNNNEAKEILIRSVAPQKRRLINGSMHLWYSIFVLTGTVAGVAQVSGKRVWLVITLPLGAAAIVVVGEHLVIVNVASGQQRAPARATHWRRDVSVAQLGSLVPYAPEGSRHEVQRTCKSYAMKHNYEQTKN